jgi:gliding motility-associated-like protein
MFVKLNLSPIFTNLNKDNKHMKSPKKLGILFILALTLAFTKGLAQFNVKAYHHQVENYIFDADSLSGFDEEAAKLSTVSDGFLGFEFKVHMFQLKRQYIKAKYGIVTKVNHPIPVQKVAVAPACTNEDFEGSTAGQITVSNQINGWTVTSPGQNSNTCLLPTANNAPSQSAIIQCNTSTGYVDPNIGGCYPIYSVFGSTPNNGNSISTNSLLPPMMGDKVIRINNNVNDYSIEKLSKTFNVTANNALFQFAFLSVFYPGHACCDAGAFQIKLYNASAGNSLIACPNFSISAPSSQCVSSNTAVTYFIGGGSCPVNNTSNFNPIFNKWNINSLDLSAYIGSNIQIDVIVTDCNAGGHWGEVYFDAQCSPMTIIGNGNGFPAGTPQITLPTCGASGATITAPSGLGNYSWNSSQISIPANLTVPSPTNQTLITNQSGTVQLTMTPPGACQPINKVITVTITPAPVVLASAQQPNCTNTLSAASLTTAGSASVNPTIQWSPAPASIASNSMSATGLATGITTITVTDNTGCKATATVNILATPPPVTFTLNNLTGSYSLTCLNPTINMSATTDYTYGTVTYTWSSTSFTATGPNVSISNTGTYNVCGMDAATTCSTCQTFTINQNFTIPTNTVSPTLQIITCGNASAATFTSTALNPTVNIQHNWYSPISPPPNPPTVVNTGTTSIYSVAGVVGTHTLQFCDLVNGCCNTKTVEVQSISGFPTFQTTSTTNYSVGCSPNQTTLCMVSAASASGAPVQFMFLPPGTPSAVPVPTTSAFSTINCTTTGVPGTWTLIVQDMVSGCQTALPVFILQNTVAPSVDYTTTPNSQTLTCFNPTIFAAGSSTTANTVVTWQIPSNPPSLASPTLILGPPTGPGTSTTALTYANYSVIATNTVNGCKTTQTVVVSQNFKVPVPITAVGNPSVITCKNDPVVINYVNSTGGSGIPGAIASSSPYGWYGPPPQTNIAGINTYSAYVAGVYTLTVQDNKNGCIGSTTRNIIDQTQPPILVSPVSIATLDCGNGTGSSAQSANMQIALTTSLSSWSILFTEYPAGSNFGPTASVGGSVISAPNGLTSTGSIMSQTITTDKAGVIEYLITNKLTGCQTTGTINVVNGQLNATFNADPVTGYAPLGVNFTNSSASSTTSNSITSVWSFGNGQSATYTTNVNPTTLYTAPGTYTVMLVTSKGTCIDTAYQVIKVEIPSKLEIPNVFTPNGDGSNDMFFLKTQNLTDITASIFDRWGNLVYEVTSQTGNIGWDGKNQAGKECPSGTYFYIIKATGKDGKEYDQKGNVSLYR